MTVLAAAPDLMAARSQMALSLGWHIVIACYGVGFPVIVLVAEWRGLRTGDPVYFHLARRWAKALGVLFAVGAVSGTILSFELGILWPGFMGRFGEVIGLPFALEGIAFFIEAIFVGIYLYGWERLSPRLHVLSGIPIVLAGVASAWFVVTANAWMNQPTGFRLTPAGEVVDPDPWRAMLNPATPVQTTHMILAAFMVAGFGVAAVYAAAWTRGRRDRYHQLGFLVPFTVAAVVTPVQIGVGDWAARFLADRQPVKLAALEGLQETQRGAPLTVDGISTGFRFDLLQPLCAAHPGRVRRDPAGGRVRLSEGRAGVAPAHPITSFINPTSVLGGSLAVAVCAYLAAVYLTQDALREGDVNLADAFRRRALAAGCGAGFVAVAGIFVLRVDARPLFDGLVGRRGLPLVALSALSGLASLALLGRRRYVAARFAAGAAVAAVLWGWAAGQYPYLLVGDMTIGQAAAEPTVLKAVLVSLGVGGALVLPALGALFAASQRPAQGVTKSLSTEPVVPQGPSSPSEHD